MGSEHTATGDRIDALASLKRIGDFDETATYEDWPAEMLAIGQFTQATCP